MNPHSPASLGLGKMLLSLIRSRQLVMRLTWREVVGRYKGSTIGLLWSFLNPVLMLGVYTFVFSVVFKNRWGTDSAGQSRTLFALQLFTGMIVHGFFAEVVNRAPLLILANVNYVKRVVFPLEILPVVSLGGALFHSFVSLGVLVLAFWLFNGYVHWTAIFLLLVFLPLVIMCMAFGWVLASLGVFVRDIGQTTGLFTTVMLFLSPVFYPVASLPERMRFWMSLNPLTFIIEQARAVLIAGQLPDFTGLAFYTVGAIAAAWAGYAWFQLTRRGFADVL